MHYTTLVSVADSPVQTDVVISQQAHTLVCNCCCFRTLLHFAELNSTLSSLLGGVAAVTRQDA